ncbi:MAG: hypothetical protein WC272_11605 [Sulfurimonas sp.]|jgi:hypothetical protein
MRLAKKIITIASLTVVGFLSVGCSGKPITIQTPEMKNIEGSKGVVMSASASGFQLLLFIPIDINDRHERAYQQLKAQAGGGYITDVKVEESWTYAFVGTVYKTTLTATVYSKE